MPLTELDEVVLDDLTHLSALLQNPDFTVAELRRASVTLSSLLIDQGGNMQKVAAARDLRILIRCPNHDDIVDKIRGYARIYTSGCATVGGMKLGVMYMLDGHQIPGITKTPDQILNEKQELTLGKFKQQICAMWMGVVVTREEVIKYVANKLGGKHYDESRRGDLALKYIALDRIRKFKTGYESDDKKFLMDYVYFELLATGRFLVESESVRELAEQLQAER